MAVSRSVGRWVHAALYRLGVAVTASVTAVGGTCGSAVIAGIAAFLMLQAVRMPRRWVSHWGVLLIVALRMGRIYGRWHLPALQLPG